MFQDRTSAIETKQLSDNLESDSMGKKRPYKGSEKYPLPKMNPKLICVLCPESNEICAPFPYKYGMNMKVSMITNWCLCNSMLVQSSDIADFTSFYCYLKTRKENTKYL